MPVLFAPVNIDGTHYVDGEGPVMNLPVSTLRRICEKVIAVNVSPLMATKYKMNIVSIALRSYNFMFRSNSFPEREKADLLIEPYNLEGYSNAELEKAEDVHLRRDIIRPMIYWNACSLTKAAFGKNKITIL